jgi:hypothetical protein
MAQKQHTLFDKIRRVAVQHELEVGK